MNWKFPRLLGKRSDNMKKKKAESTSDDRVAAVKQAMRADLSDKLFQLECEARRVFGPEPLKENPTDET